VRIHYLQHVPFEGPGAIASWAVERGHVLRGTRLYAGEPPPPTDAFDWLVVMGGPCNVYEETEHPWLVPEKRVIGEAIEDGKRVLGICLGAQLIAAVMGARVARNPHKEIGWFHVRTTAKAAESVALKDWPVEFIAFHWHGDTFEVPSRALRLATSVACENQAFEYAGRIVGVQFHLEMAIDTARELVAHCPDDLAPAPFTQTTEQILEDPRRFNQANALMNELLSRIETGNGGNG
jgi:GMP synthase-like glutamine amidotransferase